MPERSESLKENLLRMDLARYHTIVIQCSTNNTGPAEEYGQAVDSLVQGVIEKAPHAQLILSGLCPREDEEIDKMEPLGGA